MPRRYARLFNSNTIANIRQQLQLLYYGCLKGADNRRRDFFHLDTTKDMDDTESQTKRIPSCSSLIETDDAKVSTPYICSDAGDIEESVASRCSTSPFSSISRTSTYSSPIQNCNGHSRSQTVENKLIHPYPPVFVTYMQPPLPLTEAEKSMKDCQDRVNYIQFLHK